MRMGLFSRLVNLDNFVRALQVVAWALIALAVWSTSAWANPTPGYHPELNVVSEPTCTTAGYNPIYYKTSSDRTNDVNRYSSVAAVGAALMGATSYFYLESKTSSSIGLKGGIGAPSTNASVLTASGFFACRSATCDKAAGTFLGYRSDADTAAGKTSACVSNCAADAILAINVVAEGAGSSSGYEWTSRGTSCSGQTASTKQSTLALGADIDAKLDANNNPVATYTPANLDVTPEYIDSQYRSSYASESPLLLAQQTGANAPVPTYVQTGPDSYTITYYNSDGAVTNNYTIAGPQTFNTVNTTNYTYVVANSGGPAGGNGSGDPGGGDGGGGGGGDGSCDPATESCGGEASGGTLDGGTARTFSASTADFFFKLQNTPLIQAVNAVQNVTDTAGTCPPLEFDLPWGHVGTTIHCDLAQYLEMLSAVFLAIYAFMGIRVVMSA